MNINSTTALKNALRNGPYAWPGGYPVYCIAADSAPLCFDCVKNNFKLVLGEMRAPSRNDQWRVVAIDINYEDTDCWCAHCEKQIESAYGEEK
jgi:hypothetical protein